jgi:type III secretion system FlhB-like substrate exporter
MLSIKRILIIAIVILTFGLAWKFYKKANEAKKLKIGETSLSPTKKIKSINDLVDIFTSGLKLKGFIEIRNFSGKDYTLNQISLDCFSSETEKLIAEQTNIIQNDIVLKAKQTTNIPLEYDVNIINALSIFKESNVIPEDYTVWKIIAHPAKAFEVITIKNLKIKLKGFIEAQKITISVNEIIKPYE